MKCDWDGCDQEATHHPRVMVPAMGYAIDTHQPLNMTLSLKCCMVHVYKFDIKEFLNSPTPQGDATNRIFFELLAQGRTPPDFERAFIEPLSMNSEEAKMFTAKVIDGPDQKA